MTRPAYRWPSLPVHRITHQNWRKQAACVGEFEVDWMPERPTDAIPGLRVCWNCPVQLECYVEAVTHTETGIWGGKLFAQGEPLRHSWCGNCQILYRSHHVCSNDSDHRVGLAYGSGPRPQHP